MLISKVLKKARAELQKQNFRKPQFESEVLLLEVMKERKPDVDLGWLIANSESNLTSSEVEKFFTHLDRRLAGEPMAYIINRKEFYSRDFYVDKRVLIPRPETEILVEKAVETIDQVLGVRGQLSVLELGTGSGCITISVIKELEKKGLDLSKLTFTATDISQDALKVAQKNAKLHQVDEKITFIQSDLFQFASKLDFTLNPKRYTLILANLPYVPAYWLTESPSEYGLIHEPKIAIQGGQSGLELIGRFFSQVSKYLAKDGTIIIEFGDEQKEELEKLIKKYLPSAQISIFNDYQNLPRIASIKI